MAVYDTVEQALKAIRDPQTLAEISSVLLRAEYPELTMSGTTGDLGRDGRVQKAIWGDEYAMVQYSLADRWPRKVDQELARHDRDPGLPKLLVYVTHRVTSREAEERAAARAARRGVSLRVLDYGWLWTRLEHQYRDLAERALGVRPRLPGQFVDGRDRADELARRIPGFDAPLVNTDALSSLTQTLAGGKQLILLVGPGGVGKTRAALNSIPAGVPSAVLHLAQSFDRDAVGALDPYRPGVLIVDDAHRFADLSGVRLMLEAGPWKTWRIIMTLRSGYADDVRHRAGVEAEEGVEIAFGGLTRPQAAELLAGKPYGITRPELAEHLVALAAGSPLMLHLGAQAAVERGLSPRGQAELLRNYADRLRQSVPNALAEDLIVIAALFGRLTFVEHLPSIRHLYPGASLPQLRQALADAADAGLGILDDDAFTVTPDAIAPVIVLDALLRPRGAVRLRLEDFDLRGLDDDARERLLPNLVAAVAYGEGHGRQPLRHLLALRRPASGATATMWLTALKEASLYAQVLPSDAEHLLRDLLELPPNDLAAAPAVVRAAADVARRLCESSRAAGLPPLLSLAAIELQAGSDELSGPQKLLENLLDRAASYSGPQLTYRIAQTLDVTRAWHARHGSQVAHQRIALRVAMGLIAVIYEWIGPTAANAMAMQFGAVPAPETAAHRRALRQAAAYAAELIASVDDVALEELADAYPALMDRVRGIAPSPMRALTTKQKAAIRPAAAIVRRALLDAWSRLPVAVRLRCLERDPDATVARRARNDPHLTKVAALFGVTSPSERVGDDWEALQARAYQLGRRLGPTRAVTLLTAAVEQVPGRHLNGDYALMRGAGHEGTRRQNAAAIRRLRGDQRLRASLPWLLAGAIDGAGVPIATLRSLATDADTAAYLPPVLDLIEASQELSLLDILVDQPASHARLADHLRVCGRLRADARAERLMLVAERTEDQLLPQILEQFGLLDSSLNVPSALRERFVVQLTRAAATTALDRSARGHLTDAFALVVWWRTDTWLDVIDARRRVLLEARDGDYRMWDLLAEDLKLALDDLTDRQRDAALERVAGWVEELDRRDNRWRVERDLLELLERIGEGRPGIVDVIVRWVVAGGAGRDRALMLLAGLADRDEAGPVIDALLEEPTSSLTDDALIEAITAPPMSWVGDLDERYRQRVKFFTARRRRGSRRARQFAATAQAHFRRLLDEELERSRARSEGYGRS